MSAITTHVLDTSLGRPGSGLPVTLAQRQADGSFGELARGVTDADGRVADLLAADRPLGVGIYSLTFETGAYFTARGTQSFYPLATVVFEVRDPDQHYHVPLLLSPFGYSTYRGS